ncbi:unnamed protein product [Ranitomeya imitator]|uniref:Neurotransmitter-gated ion-channel ligand-binding domain-containing protein n=1 Tax=Ranitomeya imitator TaxID=111125 RepID=A0ABN9LHQ3_9NEOB|nr:unnamed protein product [Ranitomeya imitator]
MVPRRCWIHHSVLVPALLMISAANRADNAPKPALLRLSDKLMEGYKKGVRPVLDWRQTTTVLIDVMVYAILGVDEKNQVLTTYIWYRQFWVDEFLKWNPKEYENVTQISIPTEKIWVPDILINEL